MLDRKPVLPRTDDPQIASIDAAIVKQMFGEDRPLFKSALSRLLRDYAQFAQPIAAPLDDPGARSELEAQLHKLRGSAGLIGATRIMRLAGRAETELGQGRTLDLVRPILEQLSSAFCELRDEAQLWLSGQTQREATLSDVAPRTTLSVADVDALSALLDARNLAALDAFSLLSPSLNDLLGAPRFDRMRDAVDNLDFQLGAKLLRESRAAIV
jgi:HPt (histidine-containing phosphotransfer) domain-containing protein